MSNIWKVLFIILFSINAIVIGTIGYKVITLPDYDQLSEPSTQSKDSNLQVVANNETIEKIINDNIDDNMYVNVSTSGIEIETLYSVLNIDVPVNVSIEPLVKDDKIILQLKDIDIARFSVSLDLIYDTLKNHVTLDNGMEFSDDAPEIIIDSKVFKQQLEYDVTIDEIDYKNDKWYFSVDGLF